MAFAEFWTIMWELPKILPHEMTLNSDMGHTQLLSPTPPLNGTPNYYTLLVGNYRNRFMYWVRA